MAEAGAGHAHARARSGAVGGDRCEARARNNGGGSAEKKLRKATMARAHLAEGGVRTRARASGRLTAGPAVSEREEVRARGELGQLGRLRGEGAGLREIRPKAISGFYFDLKI